jgi:hypothetical protein
MRADPSLLLSLVVMVVSGWAVLAATAWPWKAALFPLVIGIPVFLLAATEFVLAALGRAASGDGAAVDLVLSHPLGRSRARWRTAAMCAWMLAFALLIVSLGFSLAIPLFVLLYLRAQARAAWAPSVTLSAAAWAIVHGLFVRLLSVPFPEGWLPKALRALGAPI